MAAVFNALSMPSWRFMIEEAKLIMQTPSAHLLGPVTDRIALLE